MANDLLQERIQHSGILGPTCPPNYRHVMLRRKLVSEEVAVLGLEIYHSADSEGGLKVSVTLLSCTQGMPISGEYIKERRRNVEAMGVGSLERCAVVMAALLGEV